MMFTRGDLWELLMRRLTDTVVSYLKAQVEAGAQALQLFDSWVGYLSPDDYTRHVLPHSRRVFQELSGLGVPLIHFGTDTATLLEGMAEAGGDVIGVGWRVPLDEAGGRSRAERRRLGGPQPAGPFASFRLDLARA